MKRVVLRQARIADAPAVYALLLGARHEIPLASNFEGDRNRGWVVDECRHRHVWVAALGDIVAAAMVMNANQILYLVTAAEHRRRGFARALMRQAKRRAGYRHWGSLKAKAKADNPGILALMKDEGFEPDPAPTTRDAEGWQHYVWRRLGQTRRSSGPRSAACHARRPTG
jgi:GNAT superfamily N-acetyltransferase